MPVLSFLKAFGGEKGKQVVQDLNDHLVAFDPHTAGVAQLQVMQEAVAKVGEQLTTFRAQAQHERAEADRVKAQFERMRLGGEELHRRYAAETDPAKQEQLGASLQGLLTALKKIKDEMDKDEAAASRAEELVARTEKLFRQRTQEILDAKRSISDAEHDLAHAKLEEDAAKHDADNARALAGLEGTQLGGLNTAVDAMRRQTEQALGHAETMRIQAQVLDHAEAGGLDDPNVQAALRAVEGPKTSLSFADQLAALSAPSSTTAPRLEHKG